MTDPELTENVQIETQSRGKEISKMLVEVTDNDNYFRNKKIQAGNENWREKNLEDSLKNFAKAKSDEDEVVNRPSKEKIRPKAKKWKLQARNQKTSTISVKGPMCTKRPNNALIAHNPENKKKRRLSPQKQPSSGCALSSNQAKTQLKLVDEEHNADMEPKEMADNKSVGAGGQPRRQI